MIITHLRASKWNRTPHSLKDSLTVSRLAGAHVILLTEVADGKRPEALYEWAKANGSGFAQDKQPWQNGEVAALWDIEEATLLGWDTVSIGPDLGPGLPLVAIFVVLQFNDGTTGMFSTTHLPSSVEGDWRARGRRIIEYGKAASRYRQAASRMRKKFKPDFELLAADWNLNVLLRWVQNYLKITFPRHKLIIAKGGGTHGYRQIDAALVRYRKKYRLRSKTRAEVMPKLHYSSDHKGVEVITYVRENEEA